MRRSRPFAGWRSFRFPDFEQDYEFVALHHPDEYPFNEGRIRSSEGSEIEARDFEDALH